MEDQFIDPDSDFSNDENNYEKILINQIKETSKVLSQDLTFVINENKKTGISSGEDRRNTAINHIDTLRYLMIPFLDDKSDELEKINSILKEIEDFKKEYGEVELNIRGKGRVKIKNLIHNKDSIPFNTLLEFKVDRYKELFGILISSYKKNKDEIAGFSYE